MTNTPSPDPQREIQVNERVSIPRSELQFRAIRGGGPGGQHVNTSSTRIELWWSIASSSGLTDEQRRRLIARLGPRVDASGRLRIVAGEFRSQAQNRTAAEERLVRLVRRALVVPKVRRKTAPSRAAREARLDAKRRRAEKKRDRSRKDFE